MKLLFGTQSWLNALWVLVALLSGPTVVASVWLVAAIRRRSGVHRFARRCPPVLWS